jgi:DNA repair protein RadC
VKAVQILCLSELSKRLAKATAKEGLILSHPSTIAEYCMEEMRHQKQEHMKLLMLNSKSKLLGEKDISKGTVNASLVSPRELFIEALEKQAVAIILIHNHPSGDTTPSENDMLLTKRVQEAGRLIGIELLDHIIIGDNCYMSFAEEQLL